MHIHRRRWLNSNYLRFPAFCIGTLCGILWAFPLTVLGLLMAAPIMILGGQMQLIKRPTLAILVRGPFANALLSRHPFGAMTAMALGHIVIGEHQGISSRVLTHELEHVRQATRWGIVFPFAYIASSIWESMHGRDAYWHNRFEIAAREAEKRI